MRFRKKLATSLQLDKEKVLHTLSLPRAIDLLPEMPGLSIPGSHCRCISMLTIAETCGQTDASNSSSKEEIFGRG
jgi:hypothetical protein